MERLLVGGNNVFNAKDFRVTRVQVDWEAVARSLALRITAKAKDWEGLIVVVRFDYSTNIPQCLFILVWLVSTIVER